MYVLNAALLLLGLVFGKRDARNVNRIPPVIRMLSSALVLLCALVLWRDRFHTIESVRTARLIATGMGCGSLGDLIMARVIPLPEHVIFGMLAFGVGHVQYMRVFDQLARAEALHSRKARWMSLGGAWAIALLGWQLLVRNPALGRPVNYGALIYALLLSSMSGLATSLAIQDKRHTPLALGGALFLVSDIILASRLFRDTHFPQIGDAVWLTYITGQALIVGTANKVLYD
jgi:hypothetical protein